MLRVAEEWRKIPGRPWYYEVSDFGRLRSLARIDRRGFRRKTHVLYPHNAQFAVVDEDGFQKWAALAALVLEAFVGSKPFQGAVARHLNDNRSDNRPANVAWGTQQDNVDDAKRNGANFASYGRLGKPHSDATKALISAKRKGVPTGHKMSDQHRLAITEGFRKKFPQKIERIRFCACGCGELTNHGRKFLHGHAGRVVFAAAAMQRKGKPRLW